MSEKNSYDGKALRVDLTTGEIKTEVLEEIILRKYLGGSALASYFLLKELKKGVDPLGPENILVFSIGILTGTIIPGASRFTIAAKSPLTGGIAEAEAGGWWAPELKWAGFNAIIIKGVSPKPVYLWIHNGEAELRDVTHLTGKVTGEVMHLIQDELQDQRVRIAQIGPAGEKMVRYACVTNECKHFNGRSGLGAVMGSKRLRAVAVRGTQEVNISDPEKIKGLVKEFHLNWKTRGQGRYDYGTPGLVIGLNAGGILPTRNFREGQFEGAALISGQKMAETMLVNKGHCYACPVACKREVKVEGQYEVDPLYGGPEYETLGALGSCCGIDNLEAIAKGNELCAKYGLDTIATGVCIAFAMECFEEGIIDKKDTDGLELKFGNAYAMLEMIERIANLKGIGAILAEGTARAARKFGSGAEKYAMNVKGQELAMHEPRGKVGVGIQYAISPTGADHCEIPHDPTFANYTPIFYDLKPLGVYETVPTLDLSPKKVRIASISQKILNLYNCISLCNFTAVPMGTFNLKSIVELTEAVTGWETSLFELMNIGEKSNTMLRCFNVREGLSSRDDKIPDRFFEAFPSGPLKDKKIDRDEFEKAIKTYYAMQGWDENGVPTPAKLAELDLDWIDL